VADDTTLRLARTAAAHGVAAIYAPVVKTTAISLDTEPPSVDEIAQRMHKTLATSLGSA